MEKVVESHGIWTARKSTNPLQTCLMVSMHSRSNWNLEVLFSWGKELTRVPGQKPLRAKQRPNNKLTNSWQLLMEKGYWNLSLSKWLTFWWFHHWLPSDNDVWGPRAEIIMILGSASGHSFAGNPCWIACYYTVQCICQVLHVILNCC